MKIKFKLLITLLIVTQCGVAQTDENRIAIALSLVKNEYNGDYGNDIFSFNSSQYYATGISLTGYISPSFDLGMQGSFGNFGYFKSSIDQFVGDKFDFSLFTHYKLNNDYILKKNSKISPFISLGLGLAAYSTNNSATPWPTIITNGADFTLPFGGGLKYQLSNSLSVQYQYIYTLTNSDVHDQNRSGGIINTVFGTPDHPGIKKGNDAFGKHMLGIVFIFGKEKDSDRDGVPDKFDICSNTPLNVKVDQYGCPIDSDNDGIVDYLDKCPDTPIGIKVDQYGCPFDTDKDRVPDYIDKCPDVPGIALFDGCPDTDGDGIQDSEDKCPTVAGIARFFGCPDTDGDGIPDSEDKCPTIPGLAKFEGCIDSDGDGIPDNLDKCPSVAGLMINMGCPELSADLEKFFANAIREIQFETGNEIILPSSHIYLNKVVRMLKINPAFDLEIYGHTDNLGDSKANIKLSQNRANAIKDYFVNHGIHPDRLATKGFGSSIPIADNKTAIGRERNRRVELNVVF